MDESRDQFLSPFFSCTSSFFFWKRNVSSVPWSDRYTEKEWKRTSFYFLSFFHFSFPMRKKGRFILRFTSIPEMKTRRKTTWYERKKREEKRTRNVLPTCIVKFSIDGLRTFSLKNFSLPLSFFPFSFQETVRLRKANWKVCISMFPKLPIMTGMYSDVLNHFKISRRILYREYRELYGKHYREYSQII